MKTTIICCVNTLSGKNITQHPIRKFFLFIFNQGWFFFTTFSTKFHPQIFFANAIQAFNKTGIMHLFTPLPKNRPVHIVMFSFL